MSSSSESRHSEEELHGLDMPIDDSRSRRNHCWWAHLPKELIDRILKRLSLVDYINFSRVCKSWRSVALEDPSLKQVPWLILPYDSDYKTRTFYNFLEDQAYKFEVDLFLGAQIVGSSSGWLILSYENGNGSLFNPFTGQYTHLPSRRTVLLPSKFRPTAQRLQRIQSPGSLDIAVLSSPPVFDDSVVAGLFDCKTIAVCRPQGTRWFMVEDQPPEREYCDLHYFQGFFYALDVNGGLTKFDCGPNPRARILDMSHSLRNIKLSDSIYLVESSDNLFMIERKVPSKMLKRTSPFTDFESRSAYKLSVCCTMYKLDISQSCWTKVEDVSHWFGETSSRDQLLFLGHGNSFSLKGYNIPKLDKHISVFNQTFMLQQSFTTDVALYFSDPPDCIAMQPYDVFEFSPLWVSPNLW